MTFGQERGSDCPAFPGARKVILLAEWTSSLQMILDNVRQHEME
jgi:hypothetical protein